MCMHVVQRLNKLFYLKKYIYFSDYYLICQVKNKMHIHFTLIYKKYQNCYNCNYKLNQLVPCFLRESKLSSSSHRCSSHYEHGLLMFSQYILSYFWT